MTTIFPHEATCFVCGTQSTHPVLGSTNEFGSRDLDLRPAPMKRSTMEMWVQRCPSCGYCAGSIAAGPDVAKQIVRSSAYLAQLADSAYPALARQFLCCSLILAGSAEEAAAGDAALHAAWVCDDAGADTAAAACRLKAIGHFQSGRSQGKWWPDNAAAESLLLADLHRRRGQFEEVARFCEEGLRGQPQELLRSLLLAEQQFARDADRKVYTIEQALQGQKDA
jgi:hypothetical protein